MEMEHKRHSFYGAAAPKLQVTTAQVCPGIDARNLDRGQSMIKTSRSRLVPASAIGLLIAGLGVAFAQDTPVSGSTTEVVAPVSESPDVLTPQQMHAQAQDFLAEMGQSAQTAKQQLAKAREARDVVKVLCLNDKLTQIHVATAATRDRIVSLTTALEQNDQSNARHEFAVLQVLRDRVRTLVQESSQCVGEEAGFVGESKVTVQVDDSLSGKDSTDVPKDPTDIIIEIPVVASQTR